MPRPLPPFRRPTRRRAALTAAGAFLLAAPLAVAAAPPALANSTLPVIEDFEGSVPLTTSSPGIFTFFGDPASNPALSVVSAPDRPGANADNHALDVPYAITSYGGFSDNLSAAENWSGYAGFSFWVKGSNTGQRIEYEIKDGGPDGEHSELWQGFFQDDTAGWKQVQTPFADLVKRTDYQPPNSPQDGVLSLTQMWGLAINLPNSSGHLVFDDFAVYGTATPSVSIGRTTTLVNAGDTASVPVKITTPDGSPLSTGVTVRYSTGTGTAVAGTDYTATTGFVRFRAGSPSGSTLNVTVPTTGGTPASEAKTVPLTITAVGASVSRASSLVVINAHGLPYLDASLPVQQRVDDLMSRMTTADKVGQMTQAERAAVGDGSDITTYRLGSLLSGGGSVPASNTPAGWADMIDGYQTQALSTPLQVPMIYGIDSVHGDNNLAGATLFPHNIGIGATRDPAISYQEGVVAATETRATGVPWAFSPCVCVTRDPRWGRSYESFGEDPSLVQQMETVIDGLQGDGDMTKNSAVLATAKHFLGDGGTQYGSSTTGNYKIDQGVTYATPQQLDALYLAPYVTAVDKGVGSVMPSYSSLQILGQDSAPIKMHARGDMITGVLKDQLGFKGFVISDYAAIDQIGPDYKNDVKIGINAGLDMIMVPNNYTTFISDLTQLNSTGDVPDARIDDAVRRILTQKFELGLFEHPFADRSQAGTIGSAAHRAVARQAASESQVLLQNNGVLPIAKGEKVYVAGSASNDVGNQSGGWTLTWQGQSGPVPGGTSILSGIRQVGTPSRVTWSADATASTRGYDVGIVAVGDTPYAEGMGDVGVNGHTLQLSVADKAAVQRVCSAMACVVLDVSGRPLDLTGIAPLADAVVASWLPGSEGEGVADVLFGAKPFTGRLPVTWFKAESQLPMNVGDPHYDPLFPYGWGLTTAVDQRSSLVALRDSLESQQGTRPAVDALTDALNARFWNADGSIAAPNVLLPLLQKVGNAMTDTATYSFTEQDTVVSVVRQLVQAAIVAKGSAGMSATAAATSNAEHAVMSGDPATAIADLIAARSAANRVSGPTQHRAGGPVI